MGGTSTDVCLVDRAIQTSSEAEVAGFPVRVPMLDIHTVGAGGGSLPASTLPEPCASAPNPLAPIPGLFATAVAPSPR